MHSHFETCFSLHLILNYSVSSKLILIILHASEKMSAITLLARERPWPPSAPIHPEWCLAHLSSTIMRQCTKLDRSAVEHAKSFFEVVILLRLWSNSCDQILYPTSGKPSQTELVIWNQNHWVNRRSATTTSVLLDFSLQVA